MTTIASNQDHRLVVIGVGNTGFSAITVVDVSINNEEKPSETKLQVSHAEQGFFITDNVASAEAEGYTLTNIDEVSIKTGTSFSHSFEEDGAALEDAEIYGVTVFHDEPIHKVHIKYRHFGITYEEIVEL